MGWVKRPAVAVSHHHPWRGKLSPGGWQGQLALPTVTHTGEGGLACCQHSGSGLGVQPELVVINRLFPFKPEPRSLRGWQTGRTGWGVMKARARCSVWQRKALKKTRGTPAREWRNTRVCLLLLHNVYSSHPHWVCEKQSDGNHKRTILPQPSYTSMEFIFYVHFLI